MRWCTSTFRGCSRTLKTPYSPPLFNAEAFERSFTTILDKFVFSDDILFYRDSPKTPPNVVWPRAKRYEILHQNHDPSHHGHCGDEKLFEMKVSRDLWYDSGPRLRNFDWGGGQVDEHPLPSGGRSMGTPSK